MVFRLFSIASCQASNNTKTITKVKIGFERNHSSLYLVAALIRFAILVLSSVQGFPTFLWPCALSAFLQHFDKAHFDFDKALFKNIFQTGVEGRPLHIKITLLGKVARQSKGQTNYFLTHAFDCPPRPLKIGSCVSQQMFYCDERCFPLLR